jgi:hypothetical protein
MRSWDEWDCPLKQFIRRSFMLWFCKWYKILRVSGSNPAVI